MTGETRWFRSPSVVFAALAFVVLVVAELVIGRAGGSPSDFSLFLGRFHPLVVHLPIGVLLLVGAAEVAAFSPRYRERIDPALGLALPALLVVTVTAFVLGHFLARSGGFAANALAWHRRLEFLAALGVCLTVALWTYQTRKGTPVARNGYRGALFLTLTLLSVGAHFGGTVTHGDSYLTEYAPGPFRQLLGEAAAPATNSAKALPPKPAAEPLVYADVVAPIVEKYCVECHGAKKSKGKLRLDSVEGMLKGGEDGPAIAVGSSAGSELVRRVRLPKDDDDRMPPEGKPGPTPEELAVIAFWIDRGGSLTLRVRDTLAPEAGRKVLDAAVGKTPAVPGAAADRSAPAGSANPAEPEAAPEPSAKPTDGGRADDARPEKPEQKIETPSAPAAEPPPSERPETPARTASPSGRAVLAEKCEKCHGPSKKKGGLRVDSLDALLRGGENGPAVVPGDPGSSEIVRRARLPVTQKEHMPPKKEPQLTNDEVAALEAWVRGLSRAQAASRITTSAPSGSSGASEASDGASPPVSSAEPVGESKDGSSVPGVAEPAEATKGAGTTPALSQADVSTDAPPDEALLARVPSRIVVYEDAVAPLLAKRCAKCHSGAKPAAQLRIDDYAALVEGGLSGPGIVPGKPDESFVCQRIGLPPTDDDRMPPEDEPPMTADEVRLVRFWVERGAARKLELPAKEFPAAALRAAADYTGASREPDATLRADAGCAACTLGKRSGPKRGVFAAVAFLLGALAARRAARRPWFGARRTPT